MPSIFVLAAIDLSFLYQHWQQRQFPVALLLLGACWLGNFGLYFELVLHQDATSDYLQNFHHQYFFHLLPSNWESMVLDWSLLVGIISSVTDHTTLGISLGFLFIVAGLVHLVRQSKEEAILLLIAPILLCLIASHFGFYSLIKRLTVFFVPLLMLLLGIGLESFWPKKNLWIRYTLGIVLLISLIHKDGYQYFWTKMEFEDSKSSLAYLQTQHQGSPIFVQADGVPGFRFYNEKQDDAYHLSPVALAKWNQFPTAKILDNPKQQFWLFFSHTFPNTKEEYLNQAQKIATPIQDYQTEAASVYLFQKK